MLCESAKGALLPATGESAAITVTNTVIPRNTACWPWACIRALNITIKPTEETKPAMVWWVLGQGISPS